MTDSLGVPPADFELSDQDAAVVGCAEPGSEHLPTSLIRQLGKKLNMNVISGLFAMGPTYFGLNGCCSNIDHGMCSQNHTVLSRQSEFCTVQ